MDDLIFDASAVIVLPTGKIVVGGQAGATSWALRRFEADGQLDGDFGAAGKVTGTGGEPVLAFAPPNHILVGTTVDKDGNDYDVEVLGLFAY